MFALLAFCTQLARLPDRVKDRGSYRKPKVQKMAEITGFCLLYGHTLTQPVSHYTTTKVQILPLAYLGERCAQKEMHSREAEKRVFPFSELFSNGGWLIRKHKFS